MTAFGQEGLSLRTVHESSNPAEAVLRVRGDHRSAYPISRYLTGKFCEHLGANIYKGMDAQVLANPTFGEEPFRTGQNSWDGGARFLAEDELIDERVRRIASGMGWPEEALDRLVEERRDALATFWGRVGDRGAVVTSPDTAPSGSRAQRVEVARAGLGIAQWNYLPLHRARQYEFEIFIRSPDIENFSLRLEQGEGGAVARAGISGASGEWKRFTGTLTLDASFVAGELCQVSLTAGSPGQFVIQRALLRPSDHVDGADPDVVRLLKESRLPILRWPGGNFASAYRWREGVGPLENRPTVPNYAWAGLEPNLFGTDEFIEFCRAVGAEPMICVNAGTGTPEEAARWVEYCNGPADSPMGKLRAANGHSEPHNIRHWEIGNELWGKWQVNWTTPTGNADRYLQFSEAMLAADPNIELYGCGAPVYWASRWNDTLIADTGGEVERITEHLLLGGPIDRSVDPLELNREYMGAPEAIAQAWARTRDMMLAAGVKSPRMALTELQIFSRLGEHSNPDEPGRLTRANMVTARTQAEALYNILLYHAAIRLAPFVEVITHSATVNHGGGLAKHREQVYAHPCHYAQSAFADLAGAIPVAVEIECAMEEVPMVTPDLRRVTEGATFGAIDALAAISDEELWLSIVHRGSSGPIRLMVDLQGVATAGPAELRTLSAELPWSANHFDDRDRIVPVDSTVEVRNGKLVLELEPFSVVRVRAGLAGDG